MAYVLTTDHASTPIAAPDYPHHARCDIHVSAVMPCLNEERTIGICVEKALECFLRLGINGEIIVSDNGYTDRSVEIAQRNGARVVVSSTKGYGAALHTGILAAHHEIIIIADSDDSYDWSGMEPFIAALQRGFDLVVGNRFRGGIKPGAMPRLHRYIGNPVLSGIARCIYGVPIGDFHCGMRAFTKSAYRRLSLQSTGMEFATEMVASAARHKLRITEIPITLYPDNRGRASHLRPFRDGWRHLRFILTYAPDQLYIFPGILFIVLGTVLQGLLLGGPRELYGHYLGVHYVALGSLLFLSGFNIVAFGVLAKFAMLIRYPAHTTALVRWLLARYRLETTLCIGAMLLVLGITINMAIFLRWVGTAFGPMLETIHLSFIASNLCILGINTMLVAFLLDMMIAMIRNDERIAHHKPSEP